MIGAEIAGVAGSSILSLRSFPLCDSVTFLDATITTDEGLMALQFPLVRRTHNGQSTTSGVTYTPRSKYGWGVGEARKTKLRHWMAALDHREPAGILWVFGYGKGDWQSDSRPEPFVLCSHQTGLPP